MQLRLKKKVSGKTDIRELWTCDGFTADYIREELDFPTALQVGYLIKSSYLMRILLPPEPDRKKRKYQKSLPLQAIGYITKPLCALASLAEI